MGLNLNIWAEMNQSNLVWQRDLASDDLSSLYVDVPLNDGKENQSYMVVDAPDDGDSRCGRAFQPCIEIFTKISFKSNPDK